MKKHILLLFITCACFLVEADVISWLRFEENGGDMAFDETGLLDGELKSFFTTVPGGGDDPGEGWSVDVPDSLISLTGEANTGSIRMRGTAYIDLSNFNDVDLGTEFTVEFFMKSDPLDLGTVVIFSLADDLGQGLNMLLVDDASANYGSTSINGAETIRLLGVVPEIQFDVWQHVALVKQPGLTQFFINGVLVDQETYTAENTPYIIDGTGILGDRTLGNEDGGSFRGWLDEFRISDEALTPNQFLIMVPEPSSLILLGLGLIGLCRRKK